MSSTTKPQSEPYWILVLVLAVVLGVPAIAMNVALLVATTR